MECHIRTLLFIVTTCFSDLANLTADVETDPVCGRSQVELDMEEVDKLIRMGFTKMNIADIMGISRKTLYNKIMAVQQQGPSGRVSNRFVQMTDNGLDAKVKSIKQTHPQYNSAISEKHVVTLNTNIPLITWYDRMQHMLLGNTN